MKKNILSLITILSFGLIGNAQTFEIYEGLGSTTDISGTTLNVTLDGDFYEGYFFVKNTTTTPIKTNIRRVNILTTSSAITYGICWGVVDPNNPGAPGTCYAPSATNTFTTPGHAPLTINNIGSITADVGYDMGSNEQVHFRYYIEDTTGLVYDSLDIKINNVLAVKEVKNMVSFNTFPNPANDVLNLTVQGSSDNALKMVDVLGNVIAEEKFGASKKLDVSQFKNGVYILTIYSNGKMVQTKRVVVRH
ncbi:MAG: T9SS type A sorting domain-containing protein [Crocinitomicaceae bacterium]|nr:T9SS type A sorting domain-containing protein [Crocinitomicaceae bacterium]